MCLGWVLLWDKSSVYAPYWLELSQSFKQNVVQSTVNLHHIDCLSMDVTLCIALAFGGNVGVLSSLKNDVVEEGWIFITLGHRCWWRQTCSTRGGRLLLP